MTEFEIPYKQFPNGPCPQGELCTETRCFGQGVLGKGGVRGTRMILFVECGPSVEGYALNMLSPSTATDLRVRIMGWKGP